jgi:hypothetical protein
MSKRRRWRNKGESEPTKTAPERATASDAGAWGCSGRGSGEYGRTGEWKRERLRIFSFLLKPDTYTQRPPLSKLLYS